MSVTGFTREQQQGLLDLLVVGMYADRHLATLEDDRIQQALDTLQFKSDHERREFFEAAITRASGQTNSPEAIRAYVTRLASHFPTPAIRRTVYDILDDLLTIDDRVTSEERRLLSVVREVFQL